MPTADRRHLIALAIESYLSQDWPLKELIVVDDGIDQVADVIAKIPGALYVRREPRLTVGKKRNVACMHALGEVIAHFDDDDWSSPRRISEQVALLESSNKAVTGYNAMVFWDGKQASKYSGVREYSCGSALCYRKDFWSGHHFPDKDLGEDNDFVIMARASGQLVANDGAGMMVARTHGKNINPPSLRQFPPVDVSEVPKAFFDALQRHQQHP